MKISAMFLDTFIIENIIHKILELISDMSPKIFITLATRSLSFKKEKSFKGSTPFCPMTPRLQSFCQRSVRG